MIKGRREGVSELDDLVEGIAVGLNLPDQGSSQEYTKKLFERFEATGYIGSYWTVYHRLSAATHVNAEETIRYMIGLYHLLDSGNQEVMNSLAWQTINYTAVMLCFAVQFYIDACAHICIAYNRPDVVGLLKAKREELDARILSLGEAAGVPKGRKESLGIHQA